MGVPLPLRRRQSLAARNLAQTLLPPGHWLIQKDCEGRPLVVGPDGIAGPDLSLAHSGSWVAAAATSHGRVGIDVETPRPGRDIQGIADSYLSEGERNLVALGGERALLEFWTLREAVAKALGGGLPQALAINGASILSRRSAEGAQRPWVAAHQERDGIHLALAWAPPSPLVGAEEMLKRVLKAALAQSGTSPPDLCIMPKIHNS